VEPVVIAMSSAFNAFPAPCKRRDSGARPWNTAPASSSVTTAILPTPDYRWLPDVAIAGFAMRSRRRGQGARSRAAAHLRCARAQSASTSPTPPQNRLDLAGIADPQNQAAAPVTGIKASVASLRRSDIALTPAPALGFSGAPALDGDGRFAGVAC